MESLTLNIHKAFMERASKVLFSSHLKVDSIFLSTSVFLLCIRGLLPPISWVSATSLFDKIPKPRETHSRKGLLWLKVPGGQKPVMAGRHGGTSRKRSIVNTTHARRTAWGCKLSKPSPGDIHLPARLCFPITATNRASSWRPSVQMPDLQERLSLTPPHTVTWYHWPLPGPCLSSLWYLPHSISHTYDVTFLYPIEKWVHGVHDFLCLDDFIHCTPEPATLSRMTEFLSF